MSPRFFLCRRCWDWKPKESSADTDGIGGACKAHTEKEENNQEEEKHKFSEDLDPGEREKPENAHLYLHYQMTYEKIHFLFTNLFLFRIKINISLKVPQ